MLFRSCDAPVHEFAPNVLERVATTESPQPVLAVVHQRSQRVPDGATFVVVADRLADPGNAGTIIRSAEAAGADAVVLTEGSVDPYNPKVVRASAGSLFRLPVVATDLVALRAAGLRVLATSSHRGAPYTDVDLRGPVAVVLGNEAHGLDDDAPVDEWITALALALRSLPILADELRVLGAALRLRLRDANGERTTRFTVRLVVGQVHDLLGAAIIATLRRGRDVAEAITARGGLGGAVTAETRRPGAADAGVLTVVAAVTTALVIFAR